KERDAPDAVTVPPDLDVAENVLAAADLLDFLRLPGPQHEPPGIVPDPVVDLFGEAVELLISRLVARTERRGHPFRRPPGPELPVKAPQLVGPGQVEKDLLLFRLDDGPYEVEP